MENNEHIFKCINGIWQEIGSKENATILAEFLRIHNIIIDDSAQFCRMYRYYDKYYETIIYRAWNNAKVTITINKYEYE